MSNLKRSLSAVFIVGLCLGAPTISNARPIEHTIQMAVNRSTMIEMPSGSKAFRLWMDDAEFAELDTDRPLEEGANFIYAIPRKTGKTRITIIGRDSNGRDATYSLSLSSSSSGDSPSYVPVGDTTKAKATPTKYDVTALQSGLNLALSSDKLAQGSILHRAFEGAISDIKAGLSVYDAATRNNIYVSALDKLKSIGGTQKRQRVKPPAIQPKKQPNYDDGLIARIKQLENRVDTIDSRQAKLEQEQKTFLAKLDNLDQSVLALSTSIKPSFAYKIPAIGGDIVAEEPEIIGVNSPPPAQETTLPLVGLPQTIPNLPPVDNHTIANGLIGGLLVADRENQINYGSTMHWRVNSAVRLIRRGSDLKTAISSTRVPEQTAAQLLKWSNINPMRAGL